MLLLKIASTKFIIQQTLLLAVAISASPSFSQTLEHECDRLAASPTDESAAALEGSTKSGIFWRALIAIWTPAAHRVLLATLRPHRPIYERTSLVIHIL